VALIAARKEKRIDGRIRQRTEAIGQGDRLFVGAARIGRMERERGHLPAGGLTELSASVADVDVPQTREAVEIFAAGVVLDQCAFTRHPDARRRVRGRVMQRVHQVRAIGVDGRRVSWLHWRATA
jgi:hypothetical protein